MTAPTPRISPRESAGMAHHEVMESRLDIFQCELRGLLSGHLEGIGNPADDPRALDLPLPNAVGRLAKGGVVLVTDEGRGIARAVAADLRAMGHPVVRVRHGVSEAGVEGVNLTSPAAVAALLDRAGEIGPIAAIVHVLPLRVPATAVAPNSSEVRSLALLAGAAADDLRRSAESGGASVIAVTSRPGSSRDDLGNLMRTLADDLPRVRIRRIEVEDRGDAEVVAADLVREVLADDPTTEVAYRRGRRVAPLPRLAPIAREEAGHSRAILLGAPHRLAWIELAEALIAWIGENSDASLLDVSFTLTHDQPSYPFRVGIAARSLQDLAEKLRERVARIGKTHRFEAETPRNGREWVQHLAAERFEAGLPVRTDLLYAGTTPRRIDLAKPAQSDGPAETLNPSPSILDTLAKLLDVMDELIGFQTNLFLGLLASEAE